MRYHHEKPYIYSHMYGEQYICDHPVYSTGTLFKIGSKGLVVIQQRYDAETKRTWWGEIDPWLTDSIYLNPGFKKIFESRAGEGTDGSYPTVTVRQLMWTLRMKPIPKERWETVFDRRDI